jgi:hypothetical protein
MDGRRRRNNTPKEINNNNNPPPQKEKKCIEKEKKEINKNKIPRLLTDEIDSHLEAALPFLFRGKLRAVRLDDEFAFFFLYTLCTTCVV